MDTPFEKIWIGTDLGSYRPCGGTYDGYPLESLPPLNDSLLDGSFRWLSAKPVKPSASAEKKVARLTAAAQKLGLTLPRELGYLLSRPSLYGRIPSCTACEWDLGAEPVANVAEPGAFTVRVMRDQQDCCFWYLYLPPTGAPYMVNSPIPFDDPEVQVDQETAIHNLCYVAPTFEQFVYRFWMENMLWDLVNGKNSTFTADQLAYLSHYGKPPAPAPAKPKPAAKARPSAKPVKAKKPTKRAAPKKAAAKLARKPAAKKPAKKK